MLLFTYTKVLSLDLTLVVFTQGFRGVSALKKGNFERSQQKEIICSKLTKDSTVFNDYKRGTFSLDYQRNQSCRINIQSFEIYFSKLE